MSPEDWKEYINNEEEKYKKLGYIECPAFDGKKVYFNSHGLDHLIYKGRVPRSRDEVIKRFSLLPFACNILKNARNIYSEEKRVKEKSYAYFWTIKDNAGSRKIRIILRRLNNGTIHFFSIMQE